MGTPDASTPPPAAPDNPAGPASGVRYGVLAFLCGLSFVLYVDRICIGQAAGAIKEELGLSDSAMGLVFGVFTISYALFEIPTGRWGDRFGSRKVLVRIVLWWSAFTALTGCILPFEWDVPFQVFVYGVPLFGGFGLLLLVRFLFGAGEAGALPNAARVLSRWFPDGRRGPAQGLITTANLVGGAVAPLMTAVIIRAAGWRWAFLAFGCLGLVWAAAFGWWFRDDPADHPSVNPGELDLIRRGTRHYGVGKANAPVPPADHPNVNPGESDLIRRGTRPHRAGDSHPPVPWGLVFRSRNIWLLGLSLTCTSTAGYMYFSWYPTYLKQGRGVAGEAAVGTLAGLVLAGGAVGSLLGGFLGDWLSRRTGNRSRSLRAIGAGGLFLSALFLASSLWCDSALAAAACTALACFCANVQLAGWWAVVTDITGRHLGTLFGMLNATGLVGAFASQTLLGPFADWRKSQGYLGRDQWDPAFYVYAGLLLVAANNWLWIDPGKHLEPAHDSPGPEAAGASTALVQEPSQHVRRDA
jgi:MFS family permease